jgi:hypothetical protein
VSDERRGVFGCLWKNSEEWEEKVAETAPAHIEEEFGHISGRLSTNDNVRVEMGVRTTVGTSKASTKADQLEQLALSYFERAQALREVLSTEPEAANSNEAVVLLFEEDFGREGGPVYTYVAVKPPTSEHWYATDGTKNRYTWEEMANRFHAIRHRNFWVANSWDDAAELFGGQSQSKTEPPSEVAPHGYTTRGTPRKRAYKSRTKSTN